MTQDDIQRQIQQLRNDGNDEFADFVQGLTDDLTGLDEHADTVTGHALAALAMLQRLYDNAEIVYDDAREADDRALFGNGDYAALEAFLYPPKENKHGR